MAQADFFEFERSLDVRRRGVPIVELRPFNWIRENSAIVHTADNDGNPPFGTKRQEFLKCALFKQRVTTGKEEAVKIAIASEFDQHLALIHADANGADRPLATESVKRLIGAVDRVRKMRVGIVYVKHVDALHTKTLQTFLDRDHHAVVTEIEGRALGRSVLEIGGLGRSSFRHPQ